ncbi:MAG: transglycosylase SLT domain-containing protein [Lachnospiraceae bacterium]|nr:transglycosylase SLT domain-containing protein [Lachnospiraceae bacterium]
MCTNVITLNHPTTGQLKRKYVNTRRENAKLRMLTLILGLGLTLSLLLLILVSISYIKNNNASELKNLKSDYKQLTEDYNDMLLENSAYKETNAAYEETIRNMNGLIMDMQSQVETLTNSNNEYLKQLKIFYERDELYDKYEYAITRLDDGTRTDITYNQLANVEEEAKKRGIDTDLVLSIVMVESDGVETAKSSESTATGYGQFIYSTGKFVYEDLLHEGTYSSTVALNGDTNLTMMTAYLEHLADIWDEDIYMIMKNYRGKDGDILDDYMARVDKYLATKGKELNEIVFNDQ